MRKLLLSAALATLVAVPLAALPVGASSSSGTAAETSSTQVLEIPVSFSVRNVNRSKVACASDGRRYTVRGHLVAPASSTTAHGGAVTLYLHGLSFGQFFWRFDAASGYDYAAHEARLGNTSVVVDRLGYGSSDKPNGFDICVGSRADIAHQMVSDLRSGKYHADGRPAPRYSSVVLAGHSYGAQIAQVEAYSFGDIAGLVVLSYADRVQSALLKHNAAYAARVCASGGLRVNGDGPRGYAPFGPPSGAAASLFNRATPQVEKAALQLLTIDPCGDTASFTSGVKTDLANLASVHVPVLIVTGGADALFPPPAGPDQARLFAGSSSVSQTTLPGAAHALTLEAAHDQLVHVVSRWLHRHVPAG